MPIGIPQFSGLNRERDDPFQSGMSQAIQTQLNAANARYNRAKAAEQEAQNPYAGRKALEDMLHQKLVNEWYGRDKESEINLRGATGRHYAEEDTNTRYKREHGLLEPEMVQVAKRLGINLGGGTGNTDRPVSSGNPTSSNAPQDTTNMSRHDLVSRANADQASYDQRNNNQSAVTSSDPHQQLLDQIKEAMQQNAPQQQQQEQMIQGTNISMKDAREAIINKMLGITQKNTDFLGGVPIQQQKYLVKQVQKDNPNLTEAQAYEAAGNLTMGKDTLDDGTKIHATPLTTKTADLVASSSVPAATRTQIFRANQAEAELQSLSNSIKKDLKPYADTYAGYSPQQIMDSFKKDPASQKRLGRFGGAQAAQYEIAQIRNRIAGGEPGITATTELMGRSGQIIKTLYPHYSAIARQEAADTLDEYLRDALKARNAYGTSFSRVNAQGNEQSPHENISYEDIQQTANDTGMTVEEVVKKLRDQGRM